MHYGLADEHLKQTGDETLKTKISLVFLSQEDVKAAGVLDIHKAMKDVEESILTYRRGGSIESQSVLTWADSPIKDDVGRVNIRGAFVDGRSEMCCLKWTSSFNRNPEEHGLPRAISGIVLLSRSTGIPIAIMDGTLINSISNSARVGLAAKYLAREDSDTLGIIGAGVMAKAHLRALVSVLKQLKRVKVFDINKNRSLLLTREAQERHIDATMVNSAKEAVEDSDIIMTATSRTSIEPIVKEPWIKEGSLYILYGWHEPEENVILKADKIIVLNWEFMKQREKNRLYLMYKEGKFMEDDIWADLGDIIENKKPGRETDRERIFFTSAGISITDTFIASRICREALRRKLGKRIIWWNQPHWT